MYQTDIVLNIMLLLSHLIPIGASLQEVDTMTFIFIKTELRHQNREIKKLGMHSFSSSKLYAQQCYSLSTAGSSDP